MPDPRSPDHERTQLMPRRDVGGELPVGHRLQEYVVEGLIGVGGFSIVYRARDLRLDRVVALKEYIPASLALRGANHAVQARSPRHEEHFKLGGRSFINEARLLASFDHPALVKVYRFWPENGTAYLVMPLYEGATLKKWLANLGTAPSEAWLRHLADQLTEALATLHGQRCFHRDVAPDNILLQFDRKGGSFLEQKPRPVLLDFGAARRVISDATQNFTAILKNGYSPIEQYQGADSKHQGAWTDVYALSAVLYTAIAGRAPPSSIARIVNDVMVPAAQLGAGRYSAGFLAAIDAGLAVRPEQRPQSMADFRELLAAAPPPSPVPEPRSSAATASPEEATAGVARWQIGLAAGLALVTLAAAGLWWALR
jgi:serine/threonine protein kinase